jgi:hypothetical protein
MLKQKVYWCPAIYVGVYVAGPRRRVAEMRWSAEALSRRSSPTADAGGYLDRRRVPRLA